MSQVETHVGKLRKVDKLDSCTAEEWCKEYCNQNGINELKTFYDSWEECFRDEYYREFVVCNNNIYRIIKNTELDGDDVYHASLNSNGTIDYVLSFYNGGCGFSEAIEYALQNLK